MVSFGKTLFVGALALAGAVACFALNGEIKSGVEKGGALSAFHPTHVTGPDKKTDTCPVCQYPFNPAVQVWVNTDDEKNVATLIATLEKALNKNADKKMKAFVVFIPNGEEKSSTEKRLELLAGKSKAGKVSLVYVSGPKDEAVADYKINTDAKVKNTVFVYKERKVRAKFVNLTADKKGLEELNAAIENVVK